MTASLGLFHALARLGGELVVLHLLESPVLERPRTTFVGSPKQEIEKVSFVVAGVADPGISGPTPVRSGPASARPATGTVVIDKAQTTGFRGVPEAGWNFHIGGYQACEKWLKDRWGRTLTKDDIAHYHKIVVALAETIRLMAEIDIVIASTAAGPVPSRLPPLAPQPRSAIPTRRTPLRLLPRSQPRAAQPKRRSATTIFRYSRATASCLPAISLIPPKWSQLA